MWNMDGLVVIGFCNQDYTYLRNHMRIPFVVYDGFAPGKSDLMLIPMHRKERFSFYKKNTAKFHRFTAVFAVSDYYAIDLIHFLQQNGFRVPEDISVAGFDDIPMSEMISPALTTVRQNNVLRAEMAIAKLRELGEQKLPGTTAMLSV